MILDSQPLSPSYSPTVPVPRPSPVSPAVLTDYQKHMLWKRNVQSTLDSTSAKSDKRHASIVGVHELYEADELLQDWKDVYIRSTYLIWCQNHRVMSCPYNHKQSNKSIIEWEFIDFYWDICNCPDQFVNINGTARR